LLLYRLGQFQEGEGPDHVRVVDRELVGRLPDGPAIPIDEDLERLGLLDWLQVFSQAILDELNGEEFAGVDRAISDDRGNCWESCHPGCPPSALTHEDRIHPPALVPADPDRLELTLGLERLGQAGECLLVELFPRLGGVGSQLVEGDLYRVLTL